ncbi:MAG: hypothetical protein RML56_00135 [Burkholderiales bacterium]|nr:hypothetical protein [Burkholderiales bacterium]
MIFGQPSMPFTIGYSTGSPKYSAKRMNSAGASGWSRKKITWCSSSSHRSSATSSGASGRARSTPAISAPSAPAIRLARMRSV